MVDALHMAGRYVLRARRNVRPGTNQMPGEEVYLEHDEAVRAVAQGTAVPVGQDAAERRARLVKRLAEIESEHEAIMAELAKMTAAEEPEAEAAPESAPAPRKKEKA